MDLAPISRKDCGGLLVEQMSIPISYSPTTFLFLAAKLAIYFGGGRSNVGTHSHGASHLFISKS